MPFFSFTITQVTYDFTATVSTPLALTLSNTGTNVIVTATTASIQVINQIQPVSITYGANAFNQSLNTFDNVSFASITTPVIYGLAQQPVNFPSGITAQLFNSLDFQNPNDP